MGLGVLYVLFRGLGIHAQSSGSITSMVGSCCCVFVCDSPECLGDCDSLFEGCCLLCL